MADQKAPIYDGSHGEFVTLKDASQCTAQYRKSDTFKTLKGKKGAYVGSRKIFRLLSQDNAVGIRTYLGLDNSGHPQLFMVAVDSKGNDILAAEKSVEGGANGLVLDTMAWCPIFCGQENELNEG